MPEQTTLPVPIEKLLVSWLSEPTIELVSELSTRASTEKPDGWQAGDRWLKIQRTGGSQDVGLDRAQVQFSAYGQDPDDALDVATAAISRLRELPGVFLELGLVTKITGTLGLTWSPDPETDAPRYLFGHRIEARGLRGFEQPPAHLLDTFSTASADLHGDEVEESGPGPGRTWSYRSLPRYPRPATDGGGGVGWLDPHDSPQRIGNVEVTSGSMTAAGMPITIPEGADVGDVLVLYVATAAATNTLETPSGFTSLGSQASAGGHIRQQTYVRTIDGTESEEVELFTTTDTGQLSAALLAYRYTDPDKLFDERATATGNVTPIVGPDLIWGGDDESRVFAMASARALIPPTPAGTTSLAALLFGDAALRIVEIDDPNDPTGTIPFGATNARWTAQTAELGWRDDNAIQILDVSTGRPLGWHAELTYGADVEPFSLFEGISFLSDDGGYHLFAYDPFIFGTGWCVIRQGDLSGIPVAHFDPTPPVEGDRIAVECDEDGVITVTTPSGATGSFTATDNLDSDRVGLSLFEGAVRPDIIDRWEWTPRYFGA